MTTPQDPNQPQGWGQQHPGPGSQPPQGQPFGDQPGAQPVGGQPFGGQPFGGQPQGQPQGQPWGAPQQPGQPDQTGQPWAGAGAGGQGQQPTKAGWKKALPGVIAAVVAVVAIALIRNGLFASDPEVGDCTNASLTSVEVVDCDDDDASYRVAGILEDVTGDELGAEDSPCLTQWPSSVAYAVDADSQSEEGTGYCLESL